MDITSLLPKYDVTLHITHNQHKSYYEKIKDYIRQMEMEDDFETVEDLTEAINTDSLWEMQWYPHTAIGSYSIAAPTLEKLLARDLKSFT